MNIFSKKLVKSIYTPTKNTYDYDNFILGKDETLLPKFTRILGTNYSVNIYYLKIKSPELNLNKNSINVYLPMQYRKNNNQNLLNIILLKMYTKIAEQEVEFLMEKARHVFGFAPEDYEIKKMSDTLATCNKELQTIYINPYIATYEKEVIEYIIFHEFCHLKFKTHSKKFYDMLKKYIPNYENFSRKISNLKY
jgi:predicted metal-dependent hydrolase